MVAGLCHKPTQGQLENRIPRLAQAIMHPNHCMGRMDYLDRILPHIFLMSQSPLRRIIQDSTNLCHTFYSSNTNFLPDPPLSPRVQDVPIQLAFIAANPLSHSPFAKWLTCYCSLSTKDLAVPLPKTTWFTFTIPASDPPHTLSGTLPWLGTAQEPIDVCLTALAFNHDINSIHPPPPSTRPGRLSCLPRGKICPLST